MTEEKMSFLIQKCERQMSPSNWRVQKIIQHIKKTAGEWSSGFFTQKMCVVLR